MYSRHSFKNLAFVAAASVAAQIIGMQTAPATATPTADALVAKGSAELTAGKVDNAVKDLTQAADMLGMKPGSCDCHYKLGMALCTKGKQVLPSDKSKSNTFYLAGKVELRKAIKVGAGNAISKKANDYLMSNLPKDLIAPRFGEGTEMIAARLGLRSADRGIGATPKPKVFEFYADWCQPCSDLKKVMDKVQAQYGDQIELKAINVDDKANAELVDQYDVSPIPTVIYMNPDGQVVGYSVGYAGDKSEQTVQKELAKILPNKT
jgi:thiol-disulfide isomerase/thioredoxin